MPKDEVKSAVNDAPVKGPLMNAAVYDVKSAPSAEPPAYPTVPPVDERANAAFLDTIFDTDGRPNSEAEAVVETEGLDEDEDDR